MNALRSKCGHLKSMDVVRYPEDELSKVKIAAGNKS